MGEKEAWYECSVWDDKPEDAYCLSHDNFCSNFRCEYFKKIKE